MVEIGGQTTTIPSHFTLFYNIVIPCLLLFGLLPNVIVMIKNGPVDGENDPTQGFWGPKTATVNWCEADYVVTQYVAEWWNTLSSFTIVFYGILGFYKHYKSAEVRYLAAFLFFTIVGCGSAAFHGSLLRSMQMMDELPMIWGNMIFFYILISIEDKKGRTRNLDIVILLLMTVVSTYLITVFDEKAGGQDIFLVCYGSGVVFLVHKSRRLDLKYNSKNIVIMKEVAVFFYATGFVLWLTDRNFCGTVRSLNLHAIWHLFAGIGTYTAMLFWIWVRNENLERKQTVRGTFVTRWVEFDGLDKKI